MANNRNARERILETACRLFYAHGVKSVGVDRIIAESEVAKMSFYKHFPSKDDLIAAFLQRRDEQWMASFTAEVERRSSEGQNPLLACFDALDQWQESAGFRGCAFINTVVEVADGGHPAHILSVEHKRRLHDYFKSLAAAQGLPQPEAVADQLLVLAEGSIVTALFGNGQASRSAKAAAEILLRWWESQR